MSDVTLLTREERAHLAESERENCLCGGHCAFSRALATLDALERDYQWFIVRGASKITKPDWDAHVAPWVAP